MSRLFIGVFSLSLLTGAGTALAQSLPEQCDKKGQEIAGMEQTLNAVDKEIVELNGQLEALNKQRAALESDIAAKKSEVAALRSEIATEQSAKTKMCAPVVKCLAQEADIDSLKAKLEPTDKELFALKKTAGANNTAALGLANKVRKIVEEFEKLVCGDLTEGEDAPATISRCQELFNQWKSLLSEIDKSAARNQELKGSYQQQQKAAAPHGKKLAALQKNFQKNCSFSKRLKEIDLMIIKQTENASTEGILTSTDQEIEKVRALAVAEPQVKAAPAKEKKAEEKAEKKDKKQGDKEKEKQGGKWGIKASLDAEGDVDSSGKVTGKVKAKAKVIKPDDK